MKNQDIGGNWLKRGGGWLGQFSRLSLKPLSGEAWRKRGGVVFFWGGGLIPQCPLCLFLEKPWLSQKNIFYRKSMDFSSNARLVINAETCLFLYS